MKPNHLRLIPAQDQLERGEIEPPPPPSPLQQTADAVTYLNALRRGDGLTMPWPDVADLTGDLLPGWFVVIGGRAKAGKTTMLLGLFDAWATAKVSCLYVGTEQPAFINRILWAAMRLGIPADIATAKHPPENVDAKLRGEMEYLADTVSFGHAKIGDSPMGSRDELAYWVNYAADHGCKVMLYDHLHRLETGEGDAAWIAFGSAVREVKNLARDNGIVLVAGAQLKYGANDPLLGAHEAPGDSSWYGGLRIQQEADVALQLWRPFAKGVTMEQKREAREQGNIKALVQPNVMAVRCAAHRYKNAAMGEVRRLYVRDGHIENYAGGL